MKLRRRNFRSQTQTVLILAILSLFGIGFSSWTMIYGETNVYQSENNQFLAGEVTEGSENAIHLKATKTVNKNELLNVNGETAEYYANDAGTIERLTTALSWEKKADSAYSDNLLDYFDYQNYDSYSMEAAPYMSVNNLSENFGFDTHYNEGNTLYSSLLYSNSYAIVDTERTVDWSTCDAIVDYTSLGYLDYKTIEEGTYYRWDIARRFDEKNQKYFYYTSYVYYACKSPNISVRYTTYSIYTSTTNGTETDWWPSSNDSTPPTITFTGGTDKKTRATFVIKYTAINSSGAAAAQSHTLALAQQRDVAVDAPATDWVYISSIRFNYTGNGYQSSSSKYNANTYFCADLTRKYDTQAKKYYCFTVFLYYYSVEDGYKQLKIRTFDFLPEVEYGTPYDTWPTLTLTLNTDESGSSFDYTFTYKTSSGTSSTMNGTFDLNGDTVDTSRTYSSWTGHELTYPVVYTAASTSGFGFKDSKSAISYNDEFRVDIARKYDTDTQTYYDYTFFVYYFTEIKGIKTPVYLFKEFLPEVSDGLTVHTAASNLYPVNAAYAWPMDLSIDYNNATQSFDYSFKMISTSGAVTTYEGSLSAGDQPLTLQESVDFSYRKSYRNYTVTTNVDYGGFKDSKTSVYYNDKFTIDIARRYDTTAKKYYDYTLFINYYALRNYNQKTITYVKHSFLSDLETEGISADMWPTIVNATYDSDTPHFNVTLQYTDNSGVIQTYSTPAIYTNKVDIAESVSYRYVEFDESKPFTGYAMYEGSGSDTTGSYRLFRINFNAFYTNGRDYAINDSQLKFYDSEWGGYEFTSFSYVKDNLTRIYYLNFIFSDASGNTKTYTRNLSFVAQTRYYFYQIADMITSDTIQLEYHMTLRPKSIYKDRAMDIFNSFNFTFDISMTQEDISDD